MCCNIKKKIHKKKNEKKTKKLGKINIFPDRSWINCEITIQPLPMINDINLNSFNYKWLNKYYAHDLSVSIYDFMKSLENNNNNSMLNYFIVQCPMGVCSNTSNAGNINQGNRFYFYNISCIDITENNEWYYNINDQLLYVAININNNHTIDIPNIVIPNNNQIISFQGFVFYFHS